MFKNQYQLLMLFMIITSKNAMAMSDFEKITKLADAIHACFQRLERVNSCENAPEDRYIRGNRSPVDNNTPKEFYAACKARCAQRVDSCQTQPHYDCGPNRNRKCLPLDGCGVFNDMKCNYYTCYTKYRDDIQLAKNQCNAIEDKEKAKAEITKECANLVALREEIVMNLPHNRNKVSEDSTKQ